MRIFLVLTLLLIAAACPSGENSSKTKSQGPSNARSATPSPKEPDKLGDDTTVGKPVETKPAETIKPIVDKFCSAMKNKDENALRGVYSKATLRSFEQAMKQEEVETLVEYLSSEPVGDKCEVVNERVQGKVGEARVITKSYPNGIMLKFVSERGSWKMTNQSSDFDAVKK